MGCHVPAVGLRQASRQFSEPFTSMLITSELVPTRSGGGQQDNWGVFAFRGSQSSGNSGVQGLDHVERDTMFGQRFSEDRGVAADQHGAGDAREMRHQRDDAAFFGHAAGDPDQAIITNERHFSGVGIGRLAVIDKRNAVDGNDALLAMRQPWVRGNAGRDTLATQPQKRRHRKCGRGILGVMRTGQCGRVAQVKDRAGCVLQNAALTKDIYECRIREA